MQEFPHPPLSAALEEFLLSPENIPVHNFRSAWKLVEEEREGGGDEEVRWEWRRKREKGG